MSDTVRASHLLIKHAGSRRPASWKDPQGAEITHRSKEQAIQILLAHRDSITSGKAQFADLAKAHSDCGSASAGGDLGVFGRGAMQKPFEGHICSTPTQQQRCMIQLDCSLLSVFCCLCLLPCLPLVRRHLRAQGR